MRKTMWCDDAASCLSQGEHGSRHSGHLTRPAVLLRVEGDLNSHNSHAIDLRDRPGSKQALGLGTTFNGGLGA